LKLNVPGIRDAHKIVAPFTGAWIETRRHPASFRMRRVAPFTGAWIETRYADSNDLADDRVAPFTGAWIETSWLAPVD